MDYQHVAAIVLAAGKGTRMKAPEDKNKVTYSLKNQPMIWYTKHMLQESGINQIIVVVGYASDSVKSALGNDVIYSLQNPPLGTGDAVRTGLSKISPSTKVVLSMYGDDSAFYSTDLIHQLVKTHEEKHNHLTLVTLNVPDPTGLGRIIRTQSNQFVAIVEEKNATASQKNITEINTGLFCFDNDFIIQNIDKIKKNPISQEYYLTDIIEVAVLGGYKVDALLWPSTDIWCGVNTPEQLVQANEKMQSQDK